MLQLSSITKSFGERTLLEDVTWQITSGERVGLCGPNGAGKTTLLKMMAGFEGPDEGQIIKPSALTVGYLPQDGLNHAGRSILDEASSAFADLLAVKHEMHAIEERLGDPSVSSAEHETMLERYSALQDRFRIEEGYSIDLKVATVLRGLGFDDESFEQPTDSLSGGWQMRLALAKLLLGRPTLLLLDEPTNHLDLEARNWLEEYLSAYPHAVILVSHDRFFLDAVVTRITDLNLRKLTDYPGSYSHYMVERDARMEQLRKSKREQDEEIARVKMFIDRFRYQATKAAQVQSRIKMLEKVVPIEAPPERKRIHFSFPVCAKSGRSVLELHDVRKAYGDKVIFSKLNLLIERGDRIAMVGPNGAGKSTLMRMLSQVEAPDAGTRREGHQVVMQYFAQDEATRLNPALSVYETMSADSPTSMVPAIRNILGGFLFSGDDIYKKAGVLSGGERTRLAVARMLLHPVEHAAPRRADEPSRSRLEGHPARSARGLWRHADFRLARSVLRRKARDQDRGDRPRRRCRISGHIFGVSIQQRTAIRCDGWKRPRPERGAKPPSESEPRVGPRRALKKDDPATDHEQRKREQSQQRKREQAARKAQTRISDLEARIAEREQAMRDIETAMSAPGFYENRDQAQPMIDRHQTLMWELGELMHQWEEMSKAGN